MAFVKILTEQDAHDEDHPHSGGVTQKLNAENTHENVSTDTHHDKAHQHNLTSYISFGDLQGLGFSIGPT